MRNFCMVDTCDNNIKQEGDAFCPSCDPFNAICPDTGNVISFKDWLHKKYKKEEDEE